MSNILPGGHGVPQVRCPDYGVKLSIALGVAILLSIRRHPHGSIGAGVPPIGHAQALASGYQFAMFLLAALVVLASPVSFIGLRPRAPSRDESTASA